MKSEPLLGWFWCFFILVVFCPFFLKHEKSITSRCLCTFFNTISSNMSFLHQTMHFKFQIWWVMNVLKNTLKQTFFVQFVLFIFQDIYLCFVIWTKFTPVFVLLKNLSKKSVRHIQRCDLVLDVFSHSFVEVKTIQLFPKMSTLFFSWDFKIKTKLSPEAKINW